MIERLTGTIQPYAWGSHSFLADLLGTEPTGGPQAELWLGAHHSMPSTVGSRSLADLVETDPQAVVGPAAVAAFGPKLPYLLKVLAAEQPLSLQAHPSRAQAEAGYAREQRSGPAIDSDSRIFKDDWPKPEMLCALIQTEALCGFRDPEETYSLFAQLGAGRALKLVAPLADPELEPSRRLSTVFAALLQLPEAEHAVVAEVVEAAAGLSGGDGELGRWAGLATVLGGHFPGDPSVLAALMLNQLELSPGDAVYLPAGNLHAYLRGAGIEIMANSDNVLRGGLTAKHIDVNELLGILDFTPRPPELVRPVEDAPGLWHYPTPAPEFALWRVEVDGESIELPESGSGRILLVVAGEVVIRAGGAAIDLGKGQSAFASAAETVLLEGTGTAFLAAPGVG